MKRILKIIICICLAGKYSDITQAARKAAFLLPF